MNFNFKKIPLIFILIIVLFIFSRLVLTAVGWSARMQAQPPVAPRYLSESILDVWAVWDAGWYLDIAQNGYSASPRWQEQANYAFFPLYPLLMRWLGWLVGNTALAGLIISNLFFLLAAWYLWRLTSIKFSSTVAWWTVIFLFTSPFSFVFSGILTEALFLALLVAVFYYAEKEQWRLAGLLGFFLSLTKLLGVLVVPLLLWQYWLKRKKKVVFSLELLYLILPAFGLFLFMAFNEWLTGSWLAFMTIQKAWHHFASDPLTTLYQGLVSGNQYWVFNATISLIAILVLFLARKKIGWLYFSLALSYILIPLISSVTSLNSMSRYLVIIFPLYWLLGYLGQTRVWRLLILIIFLVGQLWLMAQWTQQGLWVV